MATSPKPEVGDVIVHECALHGERKGTVVQLLSKQFVYEAEDGHTYYCLYSEPWRTVS